MPDAPAEEGWGDGQPAYLVGKRVHGSGLRVGPAVVEALRKMVPDAFVGVQLRDVSREGHQVRAGLVGKQFLHRIFTVDGAFVQEHTRRPRI